MSLTDHLTALFEESAGEMPGVAKRRMFGCDAFFVNGTIFGLIWKTGRIGVKLPDEASFDELAAKRGAEPWSPGDMTMGSWLLVPESFHDDLDALNDWIARAYSQAQQKPKAGPAKAKGAASKKASPKKAPPKKAPPKKAPPKKAKSGPAKKSPPVKKKATSAPAKKSPPVKKKAAPKKKAPTKKAGASKRK